MCSFFTLQATYSGTLRMKKINITLTLMRSHDNIELPKDIETRSEKRILYIFEAESKLWKLIYS